MTETPIETRGAHASTSAQLRRVRWMVRAILLAALCVSAWANALAAQSNPTSRVLHVVPVAAYWGAVEIISRVPATTARRRALRNAGAFAIATFGAWMSYWHMTTVAARNGERGGSEYLLALVVDGLVVVASVSLVELALRMRGAQAERADTQRAELAAQEVAQLRMELAGAHRAQENAVADATRFAQEAAHWEGAARDAQQRADAAQKGADRAARKTERADADARKTRTARAQNAALRETVRAKYAAGARISDIMIELAPSAPKLRTMQEWTQDLRDAHRAARAQNADSA
jgi:hypothetical protein